MIYTAWRAIRDVGVTINIFGGGMRESERERERDGERKRVTETETERSITGAHKSP